MNFWTDRIEEGSTKSFIQISTIWETVAANLDKVERHYKKNKRFGQSGM